MKKGKGISLVLLITLVIVLFVVVIITCYNWFSANEKELNADEVNEKENVFEADVETDDINNWNGMYSNDSNVIINIYRYSDNQFSFEILNDNHSASYQLELDNNTSASQSGDWFDETYSINVKKNGNDIIVEASTTEEDGLLNKINGTYTKEKFENAGWDGKYVYDDHVIILAETSEDRLYISIDDYYQLGADDYDEKEIEYESNFFDEENVIKIEKTSKGIRVEASSTEEDDLLNEINGEFGKID